MEQSNNGGIQRPNDPEEEVASYGMIMAGLVNKEMTPEMRIDVTRSRVIIAQGIDHIKGLMNRKHSRSDLDQGEYLARCYLTIRSLQEAGRLMVSAITWSGNL